MSVKSKVEAGYQLVAKDFHTGGMIVDKMIDGIVAAVNNMDVNKDGISDVAEFAPILLKVFPKLAQLATMIDTSTVVQMLTNLSIYTVNDKTQVSALLTDIVNAIKAAEAVAVPSSVAPSTKS